MRTRLDVYREQKLKSKLRHKLEIYLKFDKLKKLHFLNKKKQILIILNLSRKESLNTLEQNLALEGTQLKNCIVLFEKSNLRKISAEVNKF